MSLLGTTGLTIALGITVFFLAGLWVSRRFSAGGTPIIVGLVTGVCLSFYFVYRNLLRYFDTDDDRTDDSDRT